MIISIYKYIPFTQKIVQGYLDVKGRNMNLLATIYILHINKCALFTFSLVHEELHNYEVISFQFAMVVIQQNHVDS